MAALWASAAAGAGVRAAAAAAAAAAVAARSARDRVARVVRTAVAAAARGARAARARAGACAGVARVAGRQVLLLQLLHEPERLAHHGRLVRAFERAHGRERVEDARQQLRLVAGPRRLLGRGPERLLARDNFQLRHLSHRARGGERGGYGVNELHTAKANTTYRKSRERVPDLRAAPEAPRQRAGGEPRVGGRSRGGARAATRGDRERVRVFAGLGVGHLSRCV